MFEKIKKYKFTFGVLAFFAFLTIAWGVGATINSHVKYISLNKVLGVKDKNLKIKKVNLHQNFNFELSEMNNGDDLKLIEEKAKKIFPSEIETYYQFINLLLIKKDSPIFQDKWGMKIETLDEEGIVILYLGFNYPKEVIFPFSDSRIYHSTFIFKGFKKKDRNKNSEYHQSENQIQFKIENSDQIFNGNFIANIQDSEYDYPKKWFLWTSAIKLKNYLSSENVQFKLIKNEEELSINAVKIIDGRNLIKIDLAKYQEQIGEKVLPLIDFAVWEINFETSEQAKLFTNILKSNKIFNSLYYDYNQEQIQNDYSLKEYNNNLWTFRDWYIPFIDDPKLIEINSQKYLDLTFGIKTQRNENYPKMIKINDQIWFKSTEQSNFFAWSIIRKSKLEQWYFNRKLTEIEKEIWSKWLEVEYDLKESIKNKIQEIYPNKQVEF
ncbi:hypothetical protein [Mycoplasmopsis gallopavonis]|uniref:Uncharacterized protein n=1 Tax=Mycoplasmopsis gallopavonis TaxID=76629 RepID=A0A449AYT7_9BACT|nr:hypothetical protein [Mycoplasmopsis gallopavonis]RIV16871.1 hypothetical protein D1113_00600 [Mycoplasmopsis gallopavonis]VEU72671.1 Uncharacterised protein [Mycoplasmopsis gallopavonis]